MIDDKNIQGKQCQYGQPNHITRNPLHKRYPSKGNAHCHY